MVSLDSPERNREFAESVGAGFVLLGDPDKSAAIAYGVAQKGGSYSRRWTFYIDADGIIQHVDRDVDPGTHGQDILHTLDVLGLSAKSTPAP